jgi:hypothetical protein
MAASASRPMRMGQTIFAPQVIVFYLVLTRYPPHARRSAVGRGELIADFKLI